jgi:hypothetical protein
LVQNFNKAFIGDVVRGKGFIIDRTVIDRCLTIDKKYSDCIYPYLIGEDVNNDLEFKAGRNIICFHDWTLDKAKEYPLLLEILEKKVLPERRKIKQGREKELWWLYARYLKKIREASRNLDRVLVRSLVSENHMLAFVEPRQILSCKLAIFTFDRYYEFALLQSRIHEIWLRRYATTLRTDISYTVSNCFQTFPFPQILNEFNKTQAETVGQKFYEYRQKILLQRQLGLTKVYNLINNSVCQEEDIQWIRRLQMDMDRSVLACYSWDDIDLQHEFYPNERKKIRFMPSPAAQREIFTRLIALNQEIAAQEAAQGLVAETGKEDESEDELEP